MQNLETLIRSDAVEQAKGAYACWIKFELLNIQNVSTYWGNFNNIFLSEYCIPFAKLKYLNKFEYLNIQNLSTYQDKSINTPLNALEWLL